MKKSENNRGAALIIVLLIGVALTLLGTVAIILSGTESKISSNQKNSLVAFYLAEAGAQRALKLINTTVSSTPLYYNGSNNLGTIISNASLGTGTYTATIASDGTDSEGNNKLVVTSTGKAFSNSAEKQVEMRIIPQYTNSSLFKYAAFGKNGISLTGNARIDSYDSEDGPYGGSNIESDGNIGTNSTSSGAISLTGNSIISGDANIGPNGNTSTVISQGSNTTITGSKSALSSSESFPDVTIPSGIGPGTALSISGNNTVNLAAGTYYYTSISISGNGKLNINGNVTVYVSGSVSAAGNGIVNTTSNTANFKLYVSGTSSVSIVGNGGLYGGVYAPNAPVSITGNGNLYGAVVGTTITFTGNAQLHYDEALEELGGGNVLSSYKVLSWKEVS